jgi:mannose-6-phosphate isomerase-like protein (cupin superfamily)
MGDRSGTGASEGDGDEDWNGDGDEDGDAGDGGARSRTVVDLDPEFDGIDEHWAPRVVGELNGQHVKLARLEGEFVRHSHPDADEWFHVLDGTLDVEFRDGTETLAPGECLLVPRGVEHRPVADEEVRVLLFEPAGTRNTGDAESELTHEPAAGREPGSGGGSGPGAGSR